MTTANHWELPMVFVTDHLFSDDVGNVPLTGRHGYILKNTIRQVRLHPREDFIYKTLYPSCVTEPIFKGIYNGREAPGSPLPLKWEFLKSDLISMPNKIIVTDSRYVVEQCLGRNIGESGLSHYHSTIIQWKDKWVFPVLNIYEVYTENFLGYYTLFRDLTKLAMIYKDPEWSIEATEREYNCNPTVEELRWFFKEIKKVGIYSMDIETMIVPNKPDWMDFDAYKPVHRQWLEYKHITSMSFSITTDYAMIIPFESLILDSDPTKYIDIWLLVIDLFSDPTITVIIQNMIHELVQLLKLHGVYIRNKIEDTMIMHSLLYPELPKSLEYIAASCTFLPYFKQTGKKYFLTQETQGLELLYKYNGTDTCATMSGYEYLVTEINDPKFYEIYKRTIRICYVLAYMELKGLKYNKANVAKIGELKFVQSEAYRLAFLWMADGVDFNYNSLVSKDGTEVLKTYEEFQDWIDQSITTLGEPRSTININSHQQLKKYFYEDKKIKPYHTVSKDKFGNKKSVPSVGDKALQQLSRPLATRPAIKEASLVQLYRKASKIDSTYTKIILDKDERFHPGWKPRGSGFSRLSSGKTIDGIGGNLQNQSPVVKENFQPDDDYILYEVDYSQAEWVLTGFEAPEPKMIDIFLQGKDAHVATAGLITNLPEAYILEEKKLLKNDPGLVTLHDVREELDKKYKINPEHHFYPRTMTIRMMGKKSNHSLDYDISDVAFSKANEIPMNEASYIKHVYLNIAYPGIKKYYARVQNEIKNGRMVTNVLGRHNRFLDRITEQYFKAGYAYKPQSTVGDLVHIAMDKIYTEANSYLPHPRQFWANTDILANVHDSLLFQRKNNGPIDAFQFLMAVRRHMHTKITVNGYTFCLNVDVKVSHLNWKEMEEMPLEKHNILLPQLKAYFKKHQL